MRTCTTTLSSFKVNLFRFSANTFMVHVRNYTDKATNKTRYVYDVLDDLKRNNLTEAMKRYLSRNTLLLLFLIYFAINIIFQQSQQSLESCT